MRIFPAAVLLGIICVLLMPAASAVILPEINDVQDTPDPQWSGLTVNITCNATEASGIKECWAIIEGETYNMTAGAGNLYYLNQTWHYIGTYNYYLRAESLPGMTNESSNGTFTIDYRAGDGDDDDGDDFGGGWPDTDGDIGGDGFTMSELEELFDSMCGTGWWLMFGGIILIILGILGIPVLGLTPIMVAVAGAATMAAGWIVGEYSPNIWPFLVGFFLILFTWARKGVPYYQYIRIIGVALVVISLLL